jgi:hypothetical protein
MGAWTIHLPAVQFSCGLDGTVSAVYVRLWKNFSGRFAFGKGNPSPADVLVHDYQSLLPRKMFFASRHCEWNSECVLATRAHYASEQL